MSKGKLSGGNHADINNYNAMPMYEYHYMIIALLPVLTSWTFWPLNSPPFRGVVAICFCLLRRVDFWVLGFERRVAGQGLLSISVGKEDCRVQKNPSILTPRGTNMKVIMT